LWEDNNPWIQIYRRCKGNSNWKVRKTSSIALQFKQQPFCVRRTFWALSLCVSLILTVLLIHQLFTNINKNPVVIFTDSNSISVSEINFPAVLICSMLKLAEHRYGYTSDFNRYNILQTLEDIREDPSYLRNLTSIQ
jgi:Amiloride-sensitive sodium channel